MNLVKDGIVAYTQLDNALTDIVKQTKIVQADNYTTFFQEGDSDKYLSTFVDSVAKLREVVSRFNEIFSDFSTELEEVGRELWEAEHKNGEQDYYNDVGEQYEKFNQ